MKRPRRTTGVWELMQLGWPYSPVASGLPGHDMEVVVRHILAAVHALVLEREYSERLIGCQQRIRDFSRGPDHGCRFLVRQFQQGSHVAACDNTALTDLELHRVNDGTRELALCDQRNGRSSRQGFTDFTGVLLRQLDHMTLLCRKRQTVLPEEGQLVEVTSLEDDLIVEDLEEAATTQSRWVSPFQNRPVPVLKDVLDLAHHRRATELALKHLPNSVPPDDRFPDHLMIDRIFSVELRYRFGVGAIERRHPVSNQLAWLHLRQFLYVQKDTNGRSGSVFPVRGLPQSCEEPKLLMVAIPG